MIVGAAVGAFVYTSLLLAEIAMRRHRNPYVTITISPIAIPKAAFFTAAGALIGYAVS